MEEGNKHCSDNGFSGEIGINESEGNDETRQEYSTVLQGASTQGVTVTYFPGKSLEDLTMQVANDFIALQWEYSILYQKRTPPVRSADR